MPKISQAVRQLEQAGFARESNGRSRHMTKDNAVVFTPRKGKTVLPQDEDTIILVLDGNTQPFTDVAAVLQAVTDVATSGTSGHQAGEPAGATSEGDAPMAKTKKKAKGKRKTEAEIRADHPDVIEGSLIFVTDEIAASTPELARYRGKQTVERPCQETGKPFRLATSDLHQTLHSPEVRDEVRKRNARERRAAAKADAPAEATAEVA